MMLSIINFCTFNILCLSGIIIGAVVDNFDSNQYIILLSLFLLNTIFGLVCLLKDNEKSVKSTAALISCHVVISCLLVGFWLFIRSNVGDCLNIESSGSKLITMWSCNPQSNSETLPVDTMIMLMLVPLIYASIFRNMLPWWILITSWVITVLWLIICITVFNAYNSTFVVVFYALVSIMLLCQNKSQSIEYSNVICEKDVEISLIKAHTVEQKNMVSNVTHDLKTVCFILSLIMILIPYINDINMYGIYIAHVRCYYRIS